MNRLLLGLMLVVGYSVASAEVIKWHDSKGIHYSDHVPSGQSVKPLTYNGKEIINEQSAQIQNQINNGTLPKDQKDSTSPQGDARSKAENEVAKLNCSQAQKNMKSLQGNQRIVKINDKGEKTFLNENEKKQELKAAQAGIDEWCKG